MSPTPATPVVRQEAIALQKIDPQEIAKELLEPRQYECFNKLITKESHWQSVNNPTSTAKGVGQLLAGTYKNLGMRHPESRISQTVATLAYIGRKYGSGGPCSAWKHWLQQKAKTGYGWY
jgi:SLT domain-containing protein